MLLWVLLAAALLKIDIYTKCRKCCPNYTLALCALKYLERLREKEKIAYLFTHTVVSWFFCFFCCFLNLAQPKPVFRLLCSFALVALYCRTSAGWNEWVCAGLFFISDIYSRSTHWHSTTSYALKLISSSGKS